MGCPFIIECRSGCVDLYEAILLAISPETATFIDVDRHGRRGEDFEAAQQELLVAFDLYDQIIASLACYFERFFGNALRRA